MTEKKRFVGTIFLCEDRAVTSLTDNTVLLSDPVTLAVSISDSGVDEIIVFDCSEKGNDISHDKTIDEIRLICKAVDVPVTGAFNIKRMEDAKKLLYAGCKKVLIDFRKDGDTDVLKEISDKFGKEKVLISYDNIEDLKKKADAVKACSSELVLFSDSLKLPEPAFNEPVLLFYYGSSSETTPDKLLIENSFLSGVAGQIISDSAGELDEYKKLLSDKGFNMSALESSFTWDDLKKNSDGMVPVIVQDYRTDQVLMLAYMNEEAYNTTLRTGKMTYFSRSRNELWIKGETSSHYQYVKSMTADCDLDTILARVRQIGAACHTGSYSCFFNEIAKKDFDEKNPQKVLDSVFEVIKDRKVNPREGSYTNYLFDKGIDKILKKVGEEATEMVIAAKNPNGNEVVYEMSDFLYHMMVLMAEKGVSWEDITDELSRR